MLDFLVSKDASHEATHGSVESQPGEVGSVRGHQRLGSSKKQSQSFSSTYPRKNLR